MGSFSAEVQFMVWERSGGLCERKLPTGQRCFAPGADYHHIILKKMGGRHGEMKKLINSEENCMLVCLGCHQQRHEAPSWNEDADELVPGRDFRDRLKRGGK